MWNDTCRVVLDSLELLNGTGWSAVQHRVAVIDSRKNQAACKRLCYCVGPASVWRMPPTNSYKQSNLIITVTIALHEVPNGPNGPFLWPRPTESRQVRSALHGRSHTAESGVIFEGIVSVADVDIPVADSMRVLGVTLDRLLTFDNHASAVARSCNYHARAIRHIRHTDAGPTQ